MFVLVINCGSSSLKFQLISLPEKSVLAKGLVERIGLGGDAMFKMSYGETKLPSSPIKADDHTQAVTYVIGALKEKVLKEGQKIDAFGHRVVHGGEKFFSSAIINDEVLACIEECGKLAPLHNPANMAGIVACQKAAPGVPNVAVFDTAFHQTMPPKAFQYALPYKFYKENGLRKYGFHGTSHKFVTRAYAEMSGKPLDEVNIVVCHLGNGSSITCVKGGKCVDTSMGLTPLAGVVMGTRCGDIDPALVLYMIENLGLPAPEVNKILNKQSGFLGVSEVSSDMRDVEGAAKEGNPQAKLVLEMTAYSIAKYVGSYVASLPKTDAIVFTAGIGENSAEMREWVCANLPGLGLKLGEKNKERGFAGCVSAPDSKIPVWVIPTNEELMIALETYELVSK